MKGVKPSEENRPSEKARDDYPGLDNILRTARKMKPLLESDLAQLRRALDSMLPLGTFPRAREIYQGRMEEDLIEAIAKWRADNWMLPVEKESEFPYARTRNLVDPLVKYGTLWLRKGYDSGFRYDGEGESIGFSRYIENISRANAIETSDLAVKGVEQWWKPDASLLEKMKAENAELKKAYASTEFDRYAEVLKCYYSDGYLISGRFRAYRLYAKEQYKLLVAYETTPNADTKKALLQHVYKHGQLVSTVPEEDTYVRKPASQRVGAAVHVPSKVHLGSATEVVGDDE